MPPHDRTCRYQHIGSRTLRIYSNRERPHHLGQFALERLARSTVPGQAGRFASDCGAAGRDSIAGAIAEYRSLFARLADGPVAKARAPVPSDPERRAENLKASAYFLDAAQVACCRILQSDLCGADSGLSHALVFLVEFAREPESGEPGAAWIAGTNLLRSEMRAAEIAAILAGYLRWLGYDARAEVQDSATIDLQALVVRAGLAASDDGVLRAPFLTRGFAVGAVLTSYEVAIDLPLAPGALNIDDPDIYLGIGGTRPGWHDAEEAKRPVHLGRYPMEGMPHADEPSTLVIREEIQRVSKRADFFKRAQAGDLGERARREKPRFPMKHPLALGMMPLIQAMVPLQGTREALTPTGLGGDLSDAHDNAQAIKALGYYLGADFVGICEAEPWMYYSHSDDDGRPISPYHRFAVVMLIDQGFDTMEGASGDDWISASQSMRAYLRGAEIAGIMAAHCRRMGYSARTHSNAHSEVIHNPAILMSGLGEVSRIGDTLLNPFIGPRSKSIVFTTDLPLTLDRPINFGLQDFCDQCRKCARECPCNAISFGPKVMFNGYEIWKADVEKCTKYRVTQMRGSACGRCMKMCPWNREDTVESRRLVQLSVDVPEARPAIIAMDDVLQNGKRNLIKRWWFDLEVVDGIVTTPAGTNERDLNLDRDAKLGQNQKLAMFPPRLQPVGGTTLDEIVPVDRTAGLDAYANAEPPANARTRLRVRTTV